MSSPLEQEIDLQEGSKPAPYKDSRGLWTVGNGRCLETDPLTGAEWKYLLDSNAITVNLAQGGADWLESQQLNAIAVSLAATFPWWQKLDQVRQDALTDMAYQMGKARFLTFNLMLQACARQDWEQAYAQALNSAWATQTPARAEAVAKQLRDGVYPEGVSA